MMLTLLHSTLLHAAAVSPLLVDSPGSVRVAGDLWLPAAAPRLYCNGSWHALTEEPAAGGVGRETAGGSDELGAFTAAPRRFVAAGDASVAATLTVKDYGDGVFVLEQSVPAGCRDTQASVVDLNGSSTRTEDYDTAHPGMVAPFLSFPAWEVDGVGGKKLKQLPYLTWQGGNHKTYQWTVQESHGVDITAAKPDGTFGGLAGVTTPPHSPPQHDPQGCL